MKSKGEWVHRIWLGHLLVRVWPTSAVSSYYQHSSSDLGSELLSVHWRTLQNVQPYSWPAENFPYLSGLTGLPWQCRPVATEEGQAVRQSRVQSRLWLFDLESEIEGSLASLNEQNR